MAKSRSDSSRYPSRYSPKVDEDGFAWVTGRQYIIELVCENKARKDRKDLPRAFYDLPEWQKFYQAQINNRSLGKLIETHGVDKIISFLMENKHIKSLRPKWVHNKLEEYKYTAPTRPDNHNQDNYNFEKKERFGTNNNKGSIISKLEELE